MGSSGGVRREWLHGVVRECQTFYGRILLEYDSCNFERAADELVQRLPHADSPLEHRVLRGLLLETALQWFAHAHRHGSEQRVHPFAVLLRYSSAPPPAFFVDWARTLDRYCASSIAQQTARLVRRHGSITLNALKVGRMLGVSEVAIKAAFRQEFGMTIKHYRDVTRVFEAVKRLGEADEKIESLAADVGYRSKDTFFRSFRRLTGTTPAAYRRLSAMQRDPIIDRLKHILTSGTQERTTMPRVKKAPHSLSEPIGSSRTTA